MGRVSILFQSFLDYGHLASKEFVRSLILCDVKSAPLAQSFFITRRQDLFRLGLLSIRRHDVDLLVFFASSDLGWSKL